MADEPSHSTRPAEKNIDNIHYIANVEYACLAEASSKGEFNDLIVGAAIALKENPLIDKSIYFAFTALSSVISAREFLPSGEKVRK